MPKVDDWGFDVRINEAAEEELGDWNTYDGPVPPAGNYWVKVKNLVLKWTNAEDKRMLNSPCEIDEPKKRRGRENDKVQYNGYTIWMNQTVSQEGQAFINAILDALGADRKAFWKKDVGLDESDPPKITRIGKLKLTGEERILINTAADSYQGQPKLKMTRALPVSEMEDDDDVDYDDVEEEYDEELEPAEGTEEDEEEYDEEEGEEYEENEEEEEDEPEPEPPKQQRRQRNSGKAPAKEEPAAAPARRPRGGTQTRKPATPAASSSGGRRSRRGSDDPPF